MIHIYSRASEGAVNLLLILLACFFPLIIFVCVASHLAVIGGSNMRGAHYQQSVGTFSSYSSSPIHFLQGNYGDACCNIFQVKKVFLFYVTYFPLGFITRAIFCLCMYSRWRRYRARSQVRRDALGRVCLSLCLHSLPTIPDFNLCELRMQGFCIKY